mmetsp:Transcript_46553/g.75991  ORF Transcript_46553/g.75991 Transcript_46553/m.75991 type:complete len:139 (+) Transcript_46553:470-886(+)
MFGNSVLQSLKLVDIFQDYDLDDRDITMHIQIERWPALQRVVTDQSEYRINNNMSLKVKACPCLTLLSMWGEVVREQGITQVCLGGCPSLTHVFIRGNTSSEDICRLSRLTCLSVSLLDDSDDWPVQVFLDCLQSLKN